MVKSKVESTMKSTMKSTAKNKLRCAVIGVGHLGKFHAHKYAAMDNVDLVGVSDINEEVGKKHAAELGCSYYRDYRELLDKTDLVSVVVPTYNHHIVTCDFLNSGVNCLVEKPIATNLEEAEEMKDIADKNSLMLSIGHIERFNPVFQRVKELCTKPEYITTERLAKNTNRSMDINVVLDLMIHDLDLVLQLVDSPIKDIRCLGLKIISKYTDAANAYITFENECVANISVSRISFNQSRKMRTFQRELYISADLQEKTYTLAKRTENGYLEKEEHDFITPSDTLQMEIQDCVDAVRTGREPLVTAESGIATLKTALVMSRQLKDHFQR